MLKEKISEDIKQSMREGDTRKRDVLRMLSGAIKNKEIEKRTELTDEQIMDVISSEVKKRKESVIQFKTGNRDDLVEKEEGEIAILMAYLPEQMTESELKKIIEASVSGLDKKDIGGAMKIVMAKVKGKADGALVSKLVKDALA